MPAGTIDGKTIPVERGSTIITSNLPFEDWTQVLASERLTGALLDRMRFFCARINAASPRVST